MLAIRGPRKDAVNTMLLLKNKLETDLKLELSVEKTKLTNPRTEPALFLGTLIHISKHISSARGKFNQRIKVVSQLRMLAPMDRIYKKLVNAGFMSAKFKSGSPKFL